MVALHLEGDSGEYFSVGAHNASCWDGGADALIPEIATIAERIGEIVPSRAFFADQGGIKIKFSKKLSAVEFEEIVKLFPEDHLIKYGLDIYLSEWDGESPMLERIKRDQYIHLWWD